MNADTFRAQVRALLHTFPARSGNSGAVVVPLRLGSQQDAATLADILNRVARSPALSQAAKAGLLRFDLRLDLPDDTGVSNTNERSCCNSCQDGKACECSDSAAPFSPLPSPAPSSATEIKGVVTERMVNGLATAVTQVVLGKGAVLTPLGRDALKRRHISIQQKGGRA